ncbi:MAG: hypothetical protein ACRDGE_12260 [Candidatus Limnocylindria bacterium]
MPALPPHIEFEHARKLASALVQGDPERGHAIRQTLKGRLQELVNRQ